MRMRIRIMEGRLLMLMLKKKLMVQWRWRCCYSGRAAYGDGDDHVTVELMTRSKECLLKQPGVIDNNAPNEFYSKQHAFSSSSACSCLI